MRKIKFRGKRKDNNKWYFGSHFLIRDCDYDWTGRPFGKEKDIHFIQPLDGFNIAVFEDTIGEYVGVEDINGVEVYEGDIVKVTDSYNDGAVFTGVVGFNCSSFMIKNEFCTYYRWMDFEVEVIGNIHEQNSL